MSEKYTRAEVVEFLAELTALCQEHDIYIPGCFNLCGGNLFGRPVDLAEDVDWTMKNGYQAMFILTGEDDE